MCYFDLIFRKKLFTYLRISAIFNFTLQRLVKMSQLLVSSFTGNYFKIPRTTYENYVNKKWDERMNQFETKQTFIKRTLSEEKNSTHEHREQFLITPARENLKRRSIKFHFSTVNRTSSKETKKVEKPVPESAPFSGTSVHTENAITAFHNRSAFLNDKEILLVKKTMNEIGFSDTSNLFTI